MLYLYAITDRPRRPLPPTRGLDDQPLERAVHRGVAGIYTAHPSPVDVSEDALWRHERVVERLMSDRTVLPARVGTAFSDRAALRRAVRDRHAEFEEALAHVRGRVELGLRVLWKENDTGTHEEVGDPGDPPASGREYLLARLDQQRHARAVADAVHKPLAESAVASRYRLVATPRLLLTAAYLVERENVPLFEMTLNHLAAEHPEVSMLSTGPWPPYNFVDTSPASR